MKYIFFLVLVFQVGFVFAQDDSLNKLNMSAYAELYYSYDFSNPQNHEKSNFIYNHKRHNEVNVNLIVVKANYTDNYMRGNLALMTGTYPQYNLSSEPNWAQFVYEANIGVKLSKKHNLWLDAGILPSHIGFESAMSADCWTLTRSMLAENSPYYETGLKLGFTNKKENLNLSFLVLNGWQKIRKPDYIQQPSFGLQVNYKPNENLVLNYSNFIGSDQADSINAFRTFHNLYLQYQPKSKVGVIMGFDIGTDKYNLNDYGIWFSPVLILRYSLNERMKIALRGEYYDDKNEIILTTNTYNGFQVSGISSNFDYKINKHVEFRIEAKIYDSKDKLFQRNQHQNYSLTTNLTMKI